MKSNIIDAEITQLTLTEFSQASGLSAADVLELVELGVLIPEGASAVDWLFSEQSTQLIGRLRRLQQDFELSLDLHALALGYRLLERIQDLEHALHVERLHRSSAHSE